MFNKISKYIKEYFLQILLVFSILLVGLSFIPVDDNIEKVKYSEFIKMVENKEVTKVNININKPTLTFETDDGLLCKTDNPRKEGFKEMLLLNKIEVNELDTPISIQLIKYVISFVPYVVIFFVISNSFKNPTNSKKNSYEVTKDKNGVKLKDVIIPNTVKKDITRNIEFLRNPDKFTKAGARMPKGMILYGPPGTGKTMIAKAIANEANVPFLYASGSEFIELYVGQGARRIRSLFKEAQEHAPCVVFIDEIDAIGGVRGNKNNSENDQSINSLLTSLDGFNNRNGILVIAATNRLDVLDPALLREGRFDQHIQIPLPNQSGRKAIIENCLNSIKMEHTIDVNLATKRTMHLSGATLSSLINEAVLITIDKEKDIVTDEEFNEAFEKIIFKSHRNDEDRNKNEKESEICAVHEAGHTIVSRLMCGNVVSSVNIIGTVSGAGGFTVTDMSERGIYTYKELLNNVRVAYAGSAAESIIFGEKSTGASNDFEKATNLLKDMALEYGMFNTPLKVSEISSNSVLYNDEINYINKLSKDIYNEVSMFLDINKEYLLKLKDALLEKESLEKEDIDKVLYGAL